MAFLSKSPDVKEGKSLSDSKKLKVVKSTTRKKDKIGVSASMIEEGIEETESNRSLSPSGRPAEGKATPMSPDSSSDSEYDDYQHKLKKVSKTGEIGVGKNPHVQFQKSFMIKETDAKKEAKLKNYVPEIPSRRTELARA